LTPQQKILEYEKAVERDPNLADGWIMLGEKQQEMQSFEDAIVSFNKAIKLDNKAVKAYLGRGQAYCRTNNFAKAEGDL
jgi:cytochrome c-type biogenesis protein CcmH/NrfG